jgi:mannose-6-phosphate isomerase-like protein (cupin superfamily)
MSRVVRAERFAALALCQIIVALIPLLGALAQSPASAGTPAPRVDLVPAARFNEMLRFSTIMGSMGGTVAVAWDDQASYMLVRRTKASEVEEHSRWDDLVIVRSGTGAIIFGPRARGARYLAPGELRGGVLTTQESRVLRAGDLARVPAGVPHAFVPSSSEPWVLLIVKVRRPTRPLKRSAK